MKLFNEPTAHSSVKKKKKKLAASLYFTLWFIMLPSKTIFISLMVAKGCFLLQVFLFCCTLLSILVLRQQYGNIQVYYLHLLTVFLPKISFFLSYSFCAPCFLLFESKSQNCSQTCPPSLTHIDGSSQTVKQFPHVNSIPERSTKSSFWWLNTLKKQKTMSPYTFLRRKLSNYVGRSSYGF